MVKNVQNATKEELVAALDTVVVYEKFSELSVNDLVLALDGEVELKPLPVQNAVSTPIMPYDTFVQRYCEGMTPTPMQAAAILGYINNPAGSVLWMSGRGGGKGTALNWITKAHKEIHIP